MINWSHQEEGFCEGTFESSFFHDEDEYGNEFSVCVKSPDLIQCAEKCVEAFNHLTESEINEICQGIISCAEDGGTDESFELPSLDTALEDEIAYVVEGEGEWGDAIGFAVKGNKVIYVGVDYFDYMKDEE